MIAAVFSDDDLAGHRQYIKEMIIAACSNAIFRKDSPGDLLHFQEMLLGLLEAADAINHAGRKSPLRIGPEDFFNPNLYRGWQSGCTDWDFFPRSLSKKEFINPYVAFKRFFRHHSLPEWKKEVQEVVTYALITDSLFDLGVSIDSLSLYFYLTKLVEAAHLIDVREITHIAGHIKNRVKGRR